VWPCSARKILYQWGKCPICRLDPSALAPFAVRDQCHSFRAGLHMGWRRHYPHKFSLGTKTFCSFLEAGGGFKPNETPVVVAVETPSNPADGLFLLNYFVCINKPKTPDNTSDDRIVTINLDFVPNNPFELTASDYVMKVKRLINTTPGARTESEAEWRLAGESLMLPLDAIIQPLELSTTLLTREDFIKCSTVNRIALRGADTETLYTVDASNLMPIKLRLMADRSVI